MSDKKLKQIDRSADPKLVRAGELIALYEPAPDERRYLHSVFCQVGMPRRKPAEGQRVFKRQQGQIWLSMTAGSLSIAGKEVEQPLPYGAMPRVALAHMSTYALQNKTREIPLGHTPGEFLASLGVTVGGRQYETAMAQVYALAASHMQIGFGNTTINCQPVDQIDTWHTSASKHAQRALWPSVIVLSQKYEESLREHAVPLDNRAILALSGSALALDLYFMMARRLYQLGAPLDLTWDSLKEQFGQDYIGANAAKDFKTAFKTALSAVLRVYLQAKVESIYGGLRFHPAPPPIAPTIILPAS